MEGLAGTSVTVAARKSRRRGSEQPGATRAPGRITGRGHRRPRLYRGAMLTLSSLGFKYPGGVGAEPPIKDWVEKKVRRHLARAQQRKGFGWERWSRRWLYDTLGGTSGAEIAQVTDIEMPEVPSRAVQGLSSATRQAESRPGRIGPITLDMKQMGERSAGNPHAAFDVAGAGNVARSKCWDTRRRKGETTGNPNLGLNRRASPRPYLREAGGAIPPAYSPCPIPSLKIVSQLLVAASITCSPSITQTLTYRALLSLGAFWTC